LWALLFLLLVNFPTNKFLQLFFTICLCINLFKTFFVSKTTYPKQGAYDGHITVEDSQ